MPSDAPARTLSVLVVEDQPDVAATLALFLEVSCNYRVTIAADGAAGVAAAQADPPDAVVCDIGLPKKDGFQVAREVAVLPRRPLLIAVTGYGDDESRNKGRGGRGAHQPPTPPPPPPDAS